jgi:predicted acylesterase/phospholipase RssA
MPASDFSRRGFLAAAGLAASAAGLPAQASDDFDPDHPRRLDHALVLSGGGARGVYEAGIIDYLRLSKQIPDGQPLRPYGIVCGTSIGALNGYFVATGQYSKLRDLWYNVAGQDVIQLKPQYADVVDSQAGVGNRVAAAMGMAFGLTKNSTGVIDAQHLRKWLGNYIDPHAKALMPFVWAVTNLTTQSAEFFYLLSDEFKDLDRARVNAAIRSTVGPFATIRESTPELLIDELQASASIPVAFDPVKLPAPNGIGFNDYCDGGVTANTPVNAARAAAANVDIVMLDPPFQNVDSYGNAVEVGLGVFGAMQRRIMESDIRGAFLETVAKRTIRRVPNPTPDLQKLSATLFASNFYVIRPAKELPVKVGGFDDAENLFATFKLGFNDIRNGFMPYVYDPTRE